MTDNKFAPSKEPSMSVNEYFENLHYKKMPTYSSISRARRKVQEDYPELRGSLYRYKKENTKKVKKWVHQTKDNQRDKNKLIEAGLKYGKNTATNPNEQHHRTLDLINIIDVVLEQKAEQNNKDRIKESEGRYSASGAGLCMRKQYYQKHNAPRDEHDKIEIAYNATWYCIW